MKKLFSYLLISSMVVLSSCTNYDDQFDDLNSQINSLKSQLEGFNSLSSGLTALQGTVASLQSAVAAIPTTQVDVSGLEASVAALQTSLASAATSEEAAAIQTQLTAAQAALASAIADNATASDTNADSIAALQTSLEAVTATLAELKTSLEGASTAAEVAALSTTLASVQEDLDQLLKDNNVYSDNVTISNKSQLDFAVSLGNKLTIVNGEVDIDQSSDMDTDLLQSVMSKMVSVTKKVDFTSDADDATATPSFTNLTGALNVMIDQSAPVSLPELVSTGTLNIVADNKITSVSAPKLTTYTTLTNSDFPKATSFNMASLKRLTANLDLNMASGTADFSSLITTTDETTPEENGYKIDISGATIVKAPLITGGELDWSHVVEPNLPVWKGNADSEFDRASKVVLPSITGAIAIVLEDMAPKATYFHYIGADGEYASSTDATYKYPSFTSTSNAQIETLIVGGSSTSVSVTGASDLTSFTITGATHSLTLSDNDEMTSYVLGHTSTLKNNKLGNVSAGSLTITGNAEITSVTADSLDDIKGLNISSNAKLETLSFAALNSLGTDTDKTAASGGQVNITGNALTASKIQLPTDADVTPAVAGKITTTSGLDKISTWIGLASAIDTDEYVRIDKVTSIVDSNGDAHSGSFRLGLATAQKSQSWTAEDQPVVIVDAAVTGELLTEEIEAVNQKSTYKLGGTVDTTGAAGTFAFVPATGETAASVVMNSTWYNSITGFVASDVDTWAEALGTALQNKLNENNAAYTVTVAQDFGESARYVIKTLDGDGTLSDTTGGNALSTITFTLDSETITAAVATADDDGLINAIEDAINASALSATWKAASVSGNANNYIDITRQLAVGYDDVQYSGDYPDFDFSASVYTNANSLVAFLPASATISQRSKVASADWRITMENTDQSFDANLLNLPAAGASQASFITTSGVTVTELFAADFTQASATKIQVDYDDVVKYEAATYEDSTLKIDLRTWF